MRGNFRNDAGRFRWMRDASCQVGRYPLPSCLERAAGLLLRGHIPSWSCVISARERAKITQPRYESSHHRRASRLHEGPQYNVAVLGVTWPMAPVEARSTRPVDSLLNFEAQTGRRVKRWSPLSRLPKSRQSNIVEDSRT